MTGITIYNVQRRVTPKAGNSQLWFLCYAHHIMLIIPTLFRKRFGDIVIASVHLSIRLSVRPSVRYVISSQIAGQNPTKFGEWLAYTSGACKSMFIFGPAPRGPGEGSNINNFQFQSQF